jgi:hypothetical protein
MSPEMLEDVLPELQDLHIMLFEACVKLSRGAHENWIKAKSIDSISREHGLVW